MDPRFYTARGPLRLARIIDGLDVEPIEGDHLETTIERVASLEGSQPGDLVFVAGKRQLSALDTARATAAFVTPDMAAEVGQRSVLPLVTKTPKAHFGRALERLYAPRTDAAPDIHAQARVHPLAYIGPGCRIGAGTEVGPFASVEFADIGEDCEIKAHAVIGGNGLGIAADESGMLSILHVGTVRLGDRVRVGSHTCIDRALMGETVVEDDVKLDNLVQIAHNCRIGSRTVMASFVGIPGSCSIGADVTIAGQVGVADHLSVGDGATLLAKSGVMDDIPAGETWGGYPAVPARQWMRQVSSVRRLARGKKGPSRGGVGRG